MTAACRLPRLSPGPVCGNGFTETGEECDCGLPSDCTTPCCDPSTCRLRRNGTCASGDCCDLQVGRQRRKVQAIYVVNCP